MRDADAEGSIALGPGNALALASFGTTGPVLIGITALFLIAAAAIVAYSEWGRRSAPDVQERQFLELEADLLETSAALTDAHRAHRAAVLQYLLVGSSRSYRETGVQRALLQERRQALTLLLKSRGTPTSDEVAKLEQEFSAYLFATGNLVDRKRRGRGYDPVAAVQLVEAPSVHRAQEEVIVGQLYRFAENRAQQNRLALKERRTRELTYGIIASGLIAAAIVLISASLREIMRWRAVANNMTEVNRQLREAQLAAEEANAAKGHFITTVSHDIRQPLHAINLYLDILSRRLKDTGSESIVERIGLAAASMSRMSRQLLDLSRYDPSGYVPAVQATSLDAILQAVLTDSAPLAWSAQVKLRAARTSSKIWSDPALVESVLRNLVWNAILYAPGGNVLFGARRDGSSVRLEVYDNGPGLPQDKADFLRGVLPSRSIPLRPDGRGGLGLGLSIVKRGAELLGGELEVQSEPGRTKFALRLPGGEAIS